MQVAEQVSWLARRSDRRKHIQVRGLCAVKHLSLVAERKLQYHARGPPRAPGAARCHTEEKVILGHALPAQRSVQGFEEPVYIDKFSILVKHGFTDFFAEFDFANCTSSTT